jgi:hypothetical protein
VASIFKRDGKWCAQLYVNGVRESCSFPTKGQASQWAASREQALRAAHARNGRPDVATKRARSFLRLSKLESEAEIVRRATGLSELAGVYFLVRDERVVYVGKSLNVYQRVASHRPSKLFDKVSFIRCHEAHLLRLEAMYISKFNPEFNQAGRTDRVPDQLEEPTQWRHL